MRSRREQHGVITGHQARHDRRDIFRQLVGQRAIIGDQHLGNARNLCGRLGHGIAAIASHKHMDFAQLGTGGHDSERGILQRRIVMFGINEDAHAATPISLSLATSASTSATFTPALRWAGSVTFSVVRRGDTSTP